MELNVFKENEKSLTVENANIKLFFQTQYSSVQEEGLPLHKQLHTHSYAEIFACISGQLIIKTKDNEYVLTKGSIAIVPIEVEHFKSPEICCSTEWAKIGLICRRVQCECLHDLYHSLIDVLGCNCVTVHKSQSKLCGYIKECCDKKSEEELSSILNFLSEFIKLPKHQQIGKNISDKNNRNAKNIDRLLKLDSIINTNFDKSFSSREIARLLHVSQRQLSRIVAENYSLSLRQMILKKQLDIVAELLVTTRESVGDIAASVGFRNNNTFHREFKKKFGVTPIAYRKKYN